MEYRIAVQIVPDIFLYDEREIDAWKLLSKE
jgi:hypothetical protein